MRFDKQHTPWSVALPGPMGAGTAMDHYRNHPEDAIEMAGLSDGANTDAATLASWTVIGNMLLNLDETLTKG